MGITLKIEVDGIEEATKALDSMGDSTTNLIPLWNIIQPYFYSIEKTLFDTEGRSGTQGGWQALSPGYKKQKIKKWGNQPILQASGKMYKSLTGITSDSIVSKTKTEMTLGTSLKRYPSAHQRGNARLPQRKAIDLTPKNRKKMLNLAIAHFNSESKKAGFK